MNYIEWVRYIWDDLRKWWPSLSETKQKQGMDVANILKRVVPPIPEDKPEARRDSLEAILQALTTLREMHTLKVVSGTQQSGYYYAPSELANFQQSLSFSSYSTSYPLIPDEALLLKAIIQQSEVATATYALLRQLKVTEPERTFIWPDRWQSDDLMAEVERQRLLEALSTKHFIRTDKSNTLGLNTYVQPTMSGLLKNR